MSNLQKLQFVIAPEEKCKVLRFDMVIAKTQLKNKQKTQDEQTKQNKTHHLPPKKKTKPHTPKPNKTNPKKNHHTLKNNREKKKAKPKPQQIPDTPNI